MDVAGLSRRRRLAGMFSAAKLRAERERAVLSMQELAQRSRVSRQTIARLESGQAPEPYPSTIRKLARALGIRPQELVDVP